MFNWKRTERKKYKPKKKISRKNYTAPNHVKKQNLKADASADILYKVKHDKNNQNNIKNLNVTKN